MISIDPQQELYITLLKRLREVGDKKGYEVYDGKLPPEKTPYPFIYLGDVQQIDVQRKDIVHGVVVVTMHVYHNNIRQRGTLSNILLDIKKICYQLKNSGTYNWMISNVDQRILPDNTTNEPLLHGTIEIELKFG